MWVWVNFTSVTSAATTLLSGFGSILHRSLLFHHTVIWVWVNFTSVTSASITLLSGSGSILHQSQSYLNSSLTVIWIYGPILHPLLLPPPQWNLGLGQQQHGYVTGCTGKHRHNWQDTSLTGKTPASLARHQGYGKTPALRARHQHYWKDTRITGKIRIMPSSSLATLERIRFYARKPRRDIQVNLYHEN